MDISRLGAPLQIPPLSKEEREHGVSRRKARKIRKVLEKTGWFTSSDLDGLDLEGEFGAARGLAELVAFAELYPGRQLKMDGKHEEQLLGFCTHVLEREPFGQDFGFADTFERVMKDWSVQLLDGVMRRELFGDRTIKGFAEGHSRELHDGLPKNLDYVRINVGNLLYLKQAASLDSASRDMKKAYRGITGILENMSEVGEFGRWDRLSDPHAENWSQIARWVESLEKEVRTGILQDRERDLLRGGIATLKSCPSFYRINRGLGSKAFGQLQDRAFTLRDMMDPKDENFNYLGALQERNKFIMDCMNPEKFMASLEQRMPSSVVSSEMQEIVADRVAKYRKFLEDKIEVDETNKRFVFDNDDYEDLLYWRDVRDELIIRAKKATGYSNDSRPLGAPKTEWRLEAWIPEDETLVDAKTEGYDRATVHVPKRQQSAGVRI